MVVILFLQNMTYCWKEIGERNEVLVFAGGKSGWRKFYSLMKNICTTPYFREQWVFNISIILLSRHFLFGNWILAWLLWLTLLGVKRRQVVTWSLHLDVKPLAKLRHFQVSISLFMSIHSHLCFGLSVIFSQHLWGFQVTRSFVRCNSVLNDLPSTTKNDGSFYEASFPKCNIKSYLVFKYKRTKVSARTFRGQINIDKILCRYQSHILIMFSLASNIYCSFFSNTDVFTLFSIFAILYTRILRNSLSTS